MVPFPLYTPFEKALRGMAEETSYTYLIIWRGLIMGIGCSGNILHLSNYKQTKQNKNYLFRNTGYIKTDYNKLRIPYYIMQQLVKQITLLILVNSTKLILKSYETSYKIHFYFS